MYHHTQVVAVGRGTPVPQAGCIGPGFRSICSARQKLVIDPCVPRWWREFELPIDVLGSYHIQVSNPMGLNRGIAAIELDGAILSGQEIELADDGKHHNIRILMGERPSELADAQSEQSSGIKTTQR